MVFDPEEKPPVEAPVETPGLATDDEKASSTGPTLHDDDYEEESHEEEDHVEPAPEDMVTKKVTTTDSVRRERKYLTGWKLASLMGSITLAAFLMLLDMSIIVTAIPRITTHFHSLQDIGWYGSAYNLASAALQPLSGKFYTYFKSKWTFLVFFFFFELGSLLCGIVVSSKMLIIGRAVAGIGSSGIQNGAFTMIAASVPLERRPALMGLLMGCAQLGLVVGPLVGGALTEYTTWRWCFYINLPIGAIVAVLILLVEIPDQRIRVNDNVKEIITQKLDLIGFVLFAPCAIMFLLALQYGGDTYPWKSATVIGLFLGGGGLLVIFFIWEHRAGLNAMIPLPILKKRQIWTACLAMLSLMMTVLVASFYLPIYFQSIKGASPFRSGVDMLPGILVQLVAAISSGVLTQKIGYYLPFAVASGALSAVGNGLLTLLGPHTSTAKWAGYQAVVGFARGIGMQMPILAIQANAPPDALSTATAVLVFSQTFGGAVFITVANVIFNNKLKSELNKSLPSQTVEVIIAAGATGIKSVTNSSNYATVIAAYAKGVDSTFYLAIAGSCVMFLASFGIGFKDIRKKKPVKAGEA